MDKPDFITEGMLEWMDQFNYHQVSDLTVYWMETYGDRHKLLTEQITEWKGKQKKEF